MKNVLISAGLVLVSIALSVRKYTQYSKYGRAGKSGSKYISPTFEVDSLDDLHRQLSGQYSVIWQVHFTITGFPIARTAGSDRTVSQEGILYYDQSKMTLNIAYIWQNNQAIIESWPIEVSTLCLMVERASAHLNRALVTAIFRRKPLSIEFLDDENKDSLVTWLEQLPFKKIKSKRELL